MPDLQSSLVDPFPHLFVLCPFLRVGEGLVVLQVIPAREQHEHLAAVTQPVGIACVRAAAVALLHLPSARDGAVAHVREVVLDAVEGLLERGQVHRGDGVVADHEDGRVGGDRGGV